MKLHEIKIKQTFAEEKLETERADYAINKAEKYKDELDKMDLLR